MVEFGRAVIATGSSPAIPPVLRGAGDRLIVNDDVFDWDELPRSVAVFGLEVGVFARGPAEADAPSRSRATTRATRRVANIPDGRVAAVAA